MALQSETKENQPPGLRELLWGALILAVVLRVGAAIWLGDTLDDLQQVRVYDQHSYQALAESILAGKGYSFDRPWYPFASPAGSPTAHWSFIYPLYLSLVYLIFGVHPLAARLLQVLIVGLLNTWLVFRIGRRLFGDRVGLVTALLSAIYPYFVFHDATLMTEPFFISAVLASLETSMALGSVHPKDGSAETGSRPGVWKWVLLGAILGLAALLRQTILLWIPFLFLWILLYSHRAERRSTVGHLVLTAAVVLLFILPWTARNYLVYHTFLPLNSNAGYALYSANHPEHGTKFVQDFAAQLPDDLTGRGLNEAQWNAALTRRGFGFILDDPGRYLLLSLNRVGTYFNFWFTKESSLTSSLMRVFSFGLYLPFYILGLILSRKDWRRLSLLYLFGVVFSLIHILTWASVRYRLPVDAAFMPFASLAVITIFNKIFSPNR